MAIGKNKKLSKKGKGQKKKTIDPLSRKEWFDLRAPVPFKSGSFGKTLINKSAGQKICTEIIKGRVVDSSLADLQGSSDQFAWRKVKLVIDEVEGRNCKTSFYGLDITRDRLCQMIRKWQTLIETFVDTKTSDGYILRIFVIAFTMRLKQQIRKTSYAKRSQVKDIRKRISEIVVKEVSKRNINEFLQYMNTDILSKQILSRCKYIYPLQNITVRKVKLIKRPKIDATKLNEMYDQTKRTGDKQDKTTRGTGDNAEDEESQNLLKRKPEAKEQE